ncbi:MAG: hypothetical protein ABH864_06535 [archaeon]
MKKKIISSDDLADALINSFVFSVLVFVCSFVYSCFQEGVSCAKPSDLSILFFIALVLSIASALLCFVGTLMVNHKNSVVRFSVLAVLPILALALWLILFSNGYLGVWFGEFFFSKMIMLGLFLAIILLVIHAIKKNRSFKWMNYFAVFFLWLTILLVVGSLVRALPCFHINTVDVSEESRWIMCQLHGINVDGIAGSPYSNIPFNSTLLWGLYLVFYNIALPAMLSFISLKKFRMMKK